MTPTVSSADAKGVLYHLDASRRDTLEVDPQGHVTAWHSANGNGYCFRSDGPMPVLAKLGDQAAVAFSGTPGVRLVGSASVEQRTVVIVLRARKPGVSYMGVWGAREEDVGLRTNDRALSWENHVGGPDFNSADALFVNGVPVKGPASYLADDVQVVALRHPVDITLWNSKGKARFTPAVGGYLYGRPFTGEIAEVIAFSRILTEGECRELSAVLTAKWNGDAAGTASVYDPLDTVRSEIAKGVKKIVVPVRTYRLRPKDAEGGAYLHLKGFEDVVIDFGGAVLCGLDAAPFFRLEYCTNVTVRGVTLDYGKVDSFVKGTAIRGEGTVRCVFENVIVRSFPGNFAFAERNGTENVYRGCRLEAGKGGAFAARNSFDGPRLLGCAVLNGTGDAIDVSAEGFHVRGCTIRQTGGRGLRIRAGWGTVTDSVFSRVGGGSVVFDAGAKKVRTVLRDNETADEPSVARLDPVGYLQREIGRGAKRVSIPKARYWLTPPPGTTVYVGLTNRTDLTVDFNGAELIGNVKTRMFGLRWCTNVTVRNVGIDYSDLPFTQAVIEKIDNDRNWDVRVIDGYPCPDAVTLHQDEIWPVQAYGAKTHELVNPMRFRDKIRIVRTGPRTYRIAGGEDRRGGVGDIAVWSLREFGRPVVKGAFSDVLCANCTFDGIRVYSTPHTVGLAENSCSDNRYLNCIVDRRPAESDLFPRALKRLRSGNHDAFNARSCQRGPLLENCTFRYHCDDCVNISGYFSLITEQHGRRIRAACYPKMHLFDPGDECQVMKFDGSVLPDVKVVSVREDGTTTEAERKLFRSYNLWPGIAESANRAFTLELDREVDLPVGSVIISKSRMGSGFVIRNCTMGHTRGRGLLIKASDGLIENNLLERNTGFGIQVAHEYVWLEGGCSQNMVVRGNVLRDNGYGIYVGGDNGAKKLLSSDAHHGFVITNNVFEGGASALHLVGCTDLDARGNKFVGIENPWNVMNVEKLKK